MTFSVAAADVSDLTVYNFGESCAVIGCDTATSGSLVVPDKIEGKTVTHIYAGAFKKCKNLTSVSLPDTVVEIGAEAFLSCSNLTEVIMSDSVERLGSSVFSECYSLKRIKLSENITSIPANAFYLCNLLEEISIPQKTKAIAENAFFSCSSIKKLIIPEGVISISDRSFSNCSKLMSICLPSTLESVGNDAFEKCTALNLLYFTGSEAELDSLDIFEKNENLSAVECITGHNHLTEATITTVKANCKQPGYSIYDCPCGYKFTGDYVDITEHNFSVTELVQKVDCINDGISRLHCSDCDYYETVITKTKGHTVVTDNAIKATCVNAGKTEGSHCSACGETLTSQYSVSPLEHDFSVKNTDDKYIASNATYTKAQSYYYSCKRCNEKSSNTFQKGDKLVLDNVSSLDFTSEADSVTLEWNKVGNASGYAVYERTSDGKWKLYKRVKNNTLKISKLTYGKTYAFAVRAYVLEGNATAYSAEYTSIKTATKPKAPTEIVAKQNNKAVTLSWKKSKGATGYRVYRYDSKKDKWIIVASCIKSNKYTIKNLESGRRYKFAVRALIDAGNKKVFSSRKSILTCTKPASPVLKATSYKTAIKLEWKKIANADGYVVYCSEKPNKGFKKVATTSSVRCKVGKLKSGKTYYFKVYSYRKVSGSRVYSYASEIKKVKTR